MKLNSTIFPVHSGPVDSPGLTATLFRALRKSRNLSSIDRHRFPAKLEAAAAVPSPGVAAVSGTGYTPDCARELSFHKWIGLATSATAIVSLRVNRKDAGRRAQRPCRLAVLGSVMLIGATGHFGGMLVCGLEHFSW